MKRTLPRKFLRNTAGTTAVEFSFVVVPLLMLVFGAVEIGRLMWVREALQSTVIAAARCMGVREAACAPGGTYSASSTVTYVRNYALGMHIHVSDADVTINNAATCSGASGFSQVTVTYTFESLVSPLLDALNPEDDLSATACFPNQASS
jgi:Flp pilus assembly protein TadG